MMRILRRLIIGKPLHNNQLSHEKLPKWKALSIFSSDALSSVAYGPEQIMLTLVAAPSIAAYGFMTPVAIAILVLLAIVALSYVQVAKANPEGGGAYGVAQKNLGEFPALVAAGAIFADYTLTAAVSVVAGTDAIVSAFPVLSDCGTKIDLVVLFCVLMLVNLRGVRESSNAFVAPTYAFLFAIASLIFAGTYQAFHETSCLIPPQSLERAPLDWPILFLVLRAIANGCSSMTGVEAIANSVPMFKPKEERNAAITTYWMAGILGMMFAGISFLIMHYHVLPIADSTALSQLAEHIFGRSWVYYFIQFSTMLVLYLAANTAYNGLPILLSIVAKDGYMPRYLATRGERLTFSNGIILLTIAAAALIIVYDGKIENLLSLYAIGVFVSFTIAQMGMVVHWRREKNEGWLLRACVNGFGALATAVVVLVITTTKFMHGAWIILLFIPCMFYLFKQIRAHYDAMAKQLHLPLDRPEEVEAARLVKGKHLVIVPVATPTRVVFETMKYARLLSENVIAVHVANDDESARRVMEKWNYWNPGVELTVLRSPYRLLMKPLLHFIERKEKEKGPDDYITVVIPEFETKKWWHRLLHNQTGWILHTTLIFKKKIIVTTVPYHLNE